MADLYTKKRRKPDNLVDFIYDVHLDDAINRLHLLIENNFNVLN